MPKNGFTSLTMRQEHYDALHAFYSHHKADLQLLGISSLSSFVGAICHDFISKGDMSSIVDIEKARRMRRLVKKYRALGVDI